MLKKIFGFVWICVSISEAAVVKLRNYVLSTKRACLVKGLKYKMCCSKVLVIFIMAEILFIHS